MSAGKFEASAYQGNILTRIFPVRVQQETLDLVIDGVSNSAVTDPPNQAVSARVSGKRRLYGVNCRKIRIRFTGAVPAGYEPDSILTVPILTPTLFEGIERFNVGTYQGLPIIVIGKTPEYIN